MPVRLIPQARASVAMDSRSPAFVLPPFRACACMKHKSNKPDAVNPAMALWFAIEDQWRRVTDLERSAS